MLHISSPSISKMVEYFGEFMEYSLDEKKVGKWIDGKPVYRKTFVIIGPSRTGVWETYCQDEIPALNIETVCNIFGAFKHGNMSYELSCTAGGGNLNGIGVGPSGISMYCQTTTTNSTNYVTIEYTKTTD